MTYSELLPFWLQDLLRRPTWNRKEINAFADFVEACEEANPWQLAKTYFGLRSGLIDRQRIADKLGITYTQLNQILFPISEGCIRDTVHVENSRLVGTLRRLAQTGQVSWNG